jgi:hypothetical protein
VRQLLTFENAKTTKGEALNYRTGILYLAPAFESGRMNTCPKSTAGCREACLYSAGRAAIFPAVKKARIGRTHELVDHPAEFRAQLRKEINGLMRYCDKRGLLPAVRINGTSDLPKLALEIASEFPDVQFYDYTKIPRPWMRTLPNYHLTFSYSGENWIDAMAALKKGINVSVVFQVLRGKPLPATWNGYRVIDGDTHDVRVIDPSGVIVGLRAKGAAKKSISEFVVIPDLVQIATRK